MARRGKTKTMGLGDFLGDQTASYIPEASLPTGPRVYDDNDDGRDGRFGGRGGDRFGDRRGGYDREPTRSDQSDQWRGDRGGGRFGGERGGDRFGDRGGDRFGGERGGDRFGDRGGDRFADRGGDRFGDRGGDRFGDRGGDRFGDRGDRFGGRGGSRQDEERDWRSGPSRDGGPSRYDRPERSNEPEERPAHLRLNLQRRGESSEQSSAPPASDRNEQAEASGNASGGDKWASAFSRSGGGGRRFGDREDRGGDRFSGRGGDRFGDRGDRFGDRGGDRFGDRGDRFGDRGDRFGDRGDRFGDRGDRFGDRGGDRFSGRFGDRGGDRGGDDRFSSRFGRGDRDRDDSGVSNAFSNLRVKDDARAAPSAPATEEDDKKARAQKLREERKQKAEEERKAAEEAKRIAAEEKKAKEEALAKKLETDAATMNQVLGSGKKGEALADVAKPTFAEAGRPAGRAVFEAVLKHGEALAKSSANWIAPQHYGELLKLAMKDADVKDQVQALYALQRFLHTHDFPRGLLEKCFMALYSLDIIEDKAFIEYKYDVDSVEPGRMKAIVQISSWLTWLETPEEDSEEEEDDE